MRRCLFIFLIAFVPASAQVLLDSARLPRGLRELTEQPGEKRLSCEVMPMKPMLNYGFRFQTGYFARIPMQQFPGEGHTWGIILKVTPEGAEAKPYYLASRINLPKIPKTNINFEMGGGFIVGAGRYKVEWLLFDDQSRICRKTWHLDARLTHAERAVKLNIPKNTVTDYSLHGLPQATIQTDDAKAIRLTVFLHVAPISMRRTTLRSTDRMTLLSSLSTLLEHVPTRSVRFVAFNLDQQKEIYHREQFARASIDEVAKSIDELELGLVDVKVLQNRKGHLDLLTELLQQESAAAEQSEVVLFLGPAARQFDKLPAAAVEGSTASSKRFLFFQLHPLFRGGATPSSEFPDSISQSIAPLKGKTVHIRTPGDFARAIRQLEGKN